ncbi:hypothetical protein HPB49_010631 [Dermacentor silvarum]|uniref:Uncharacterized protein n=1 Tax=Dermacentor silvarum TaxID=543639 RepID=A0ACB8CQT1_DERSI|nr:hypothetical protein HPB49_010631 [Dermacentor silvarum]
MASKPDSEGWTLVNRRKKTPFNKPTATTSFTSRLQGHKVILRPQGGFVLTTLRPAQLMSAVSAAASLTDNEYKETQVEIQEHKNLAVFVSTRNSVAEKLAQLTTLTIQGTSHQVSIYLAPPDNYCRGVVHGIEAHTTSAELMVNLDAPGFPILADVCPTPQHLRCPICAVAMPVRNAPHPCTPNCATATALTLLQIRPAQVYRQQTKLLIKLPDSGFTPDVAASRSNAPQRRSPSRSRSRTPDSSRRRSKSRTKRSHKSRSKSRPPPSSASPSRTAGPRLLYETTVPPPRVTSGTTSATDTLTDWVQTLQTRLDVHTRTLTTTPDEPDIDAHLVHLWDARRSLTKRWRRQRHNRKLRLRIAQLSAEALRRRYLPPPDAPRYADYTAARAKLTVSPIPRHMHPTRHTARRDHRSRYLRREYPVGSSAVRVLFTDASPAEERGGVTVVV